MNPTPRLQGIFSKSYTGAGGADISLVDDGDALLVGIGQPKIGRCACRIVARTATTLHVQYANGVTDTISPTANEVIDATIAKILHDTSVFTNITVYWGDV